MCIVEFDVLNKTLWNELWIRGEYLQCSGGRAITLREPGYDWVTEGVAMSLFDLVVCKDLVRSCRGGGVVIPPPNNRHTT